VTDKYLPKRTSLRGQIVMLYISTEALAHTIWSGLHHCLTSVKLLAGAVLISVSQLMMMW
jgi:hypothetical protein